MGDGAAPMEVEDEHIVQGDPTDEFDTRGVILTPSSTPFDTL